MAGSKKTQQVARSAITGKFVKLSTAKKDPRHTIIERVKK